MPTALAGTAAAAFLAACAIAAIPACAKARDDVPDDVARQSNPVGELDAREVRYYAKQFRTKCARCHGADGSGGGEDAQNQEVPPADLTDASTMSSRSDGQLFYQILMGGGESCAMPAFGPTSDHGWDEDKIWHMVAFVRRFAAPEEP
jgi:mono/diheme cytochrome c family protein